MDLEVGHRLHRGDLDVKPVQRLLGRAGGRLDLGDFGNHHTVQRSLRAHGEGLDRQGCGTGRLRDADDEVSTSLSFGQLFVGRDCITVRYQS